MASVLNTAKGIGNFIVPVTGSLDRADSYLDAVAGNSSSVVRALAGVAGGYAYGKVAYDVLVDAVPHSWNRAMDKFGSDNPIEGAGTLLFTTAPQVLATGLLAANAIALAVRGFKNDAKNHADMGVVG